MKKHIISLVAVVGLLTCVSLAQAAATHTTTRMINGAYLCISNSATASSVNATNWYYSYQAGTNVLGGTTNAAGFLIPGALVTAGLYPNLNGDPQSNMALQIVCGFTNNLFTKGVTTPVIRNTVWTNPSPYFANAAAMTNTVTVTLLRQASGDFPADQSGAGASFVVTFTITNGVPMVFTTNLPTAFTIGAIKVVPRIAVDAGGSAGGGLGVTFHALNLVGWTP